MNINLLYVKISTDKRSRIIRHLRCAQTHFNSSVYLWAVAKFLARVLFWLDMPKSPK